VLSRAASRASTSIDQVIPSDACTLTLLQPPPNLSDTLGREKLDPLLATFLGFFAFENAI
jgi:hypothetical protein